MTEAKKIEEFIKDCFDYLSIDIEDFFGDPFDEWDQSEISWTNENGEIDLEAVAHASEILGITVEDILSTNNESILKWLKKYCYFKYLKPYRYSCEKAYYGKGFDEIRLLEAIFDTKFNNAYPPRFDYKDITRRLIEQLKEIDNLLPGTFHQNAKLTHLGIATENFCEFNEIEAMTKSFINLANRAKVLFFMALKQNLSPKEVNEYNRLVSVLEIRDRD